MLVLFACSALPLPVSVLHQPPEPTIDSTVYPCQGGTCGCRDAKTCWTSCCCRTPAERLAWAAERGIEPPSYAVLPNEDYRNESQVLAKLGERKKVSRSCCRTAIGTTSACEPPFSERETAGSCCSKKQRLDDSSLSKRSKWVTLMEAAKCRGISFDLTNLPVCDVAIPVFIFEEFGIGERVHFRDYLSIDIDQDVPHPPPRISFS